MIEVPSDEFVLSETNTLTGTIYIDVCGEHFPERNWNDFPDRLLGMWLISISRIKYLKQPADFPFMDGPYYFKVTPKHEAIGSIAFFEHDKKTSEHEIKLDDFFLAYFEQCRKLIDYAKSRQWDVRRFTKFEEIINSPSLMQKALEKQLEAERFE